MKWFLFLISFNLLANPNTKTRQIVMEAKLIEKSKLIAKHEVAFEMEFNAMEDRCFLYLKNDRRKFGPGKKTWDCRFRTQKEIPNIAYKKILKIFEDSYRIIKKKELKSLDVYRSEEAKTYLNGKVIKKSFLKLDFGQYEISFQNLGKEGLDLAKIKLRIY